MALNVLHIVASTVSRLHVHESLTSGLILWLPAFTSPSACNSSINQERQPYLWDIWTFEFKSLSYRMTLKISIIPKSIPHHGTRTRWKFLHISAIVIIWFRYYSYKVTLYLMLCLKGTDTFYASLRFLCQQTNDTIRN